MSEAITEEVIEKVKKVRAFSYRNVGTSNIFTESGRCAPGQVVRLKSTDAKKYEGLEKCKT